MWFEEALGKKRDVRGLWSKWNVLVTNRNVACFGKYYGCLVQEESEPEGFTYKVVTRQ